MADKPEMKSALAAISEAYDDLPATSRCMFCPDWSFSGTAKEAKAAAAKHREETHPEIVTKKARYGSRPCSRPLCEHPGIGSRGPYAGLCSYHRDEARAADKELLDGMKNRGRAGSNPNAKMSPERLDEAIVMYEKGMSVRAVSEAKFEEWGFRTANSLNTSLYNGFKARGVKMRAAGGGTRTPGAKRRNGPEPTILTAPRYDAVTLLCKAGCTIPMIADLAWEAWGFKSQNVAEISLHKMLKNRGDGDLIVPCVKIKLPDVSRVEARALIEEVT